MRQRISNVKARHPVAFGLCAGIFLAASAAAAAFVIYSGVNGSTTGNFSGSSTLAAVTINGGTASGTLDPGSSVTMTGFMENNNDPNNAETVNTLTPTFTSTPSDCASHLSVTGQGALTGHRILASASWNTAGATITVSADASTPSDCASGTYTLNWSGTTTAG